MTALNESQRRGVLTKVLGLLETKFVGPDADTAALRREYEDDVVHAPSDEQFEASISRMLRSLGASHTGFFHEGRPRATGRIALGGTLTKADTSDGVRWVFQDVHPGGVAAQAGVETGDVLLAVDEKDVAPPTAMPFMLGQTYAFTVRKSDQSTATITLTIPGSHDKKRPLVVPDQVVTSRRLSEDVGLVRVSMFPGVLGMDVARDMSGAVAELACPRLIVDLRGNTGGGIGGLRLMSHLCSDRRGVGYSLTKATEQKGYTKETLPAFDRIPSSTWGVLPLFFRFAGAGRSIAVFTEALGVQPHLGQVAILVNEHSAGAAEMVAVFASENGLATLVGTKTAGRLAAGSSFRVGFGYRVMMPVAAYITWHGTNLEGHGLSPDVEEPFSVEAARNGQDTQLDRAHAYLREAVH